MGKAVAAVGTAIVGVGLVTATGGAILIPAVAGGGLAGALGTAAFGITAGQFITAGLALSAVGSSLAGTGMAPQGREPTDFIAGTDEPLPFAFGRCGVAGIINHRAAYGRDNRYQSIVSTLSRAGPIRAFVSYSSEDVITSFSLSTNVATSGEHSGAMWLQRKLGTQPQVALSSPSGLDAGATIPRWGTDYKMSGAACAMLTMYENSKFSEFPGGIEKPLHVIEGKFGWDPRLDSTYPGGSGPCRLLQPSTWVWIDNGAIAALNWSIGMWEGDSGGGLYGVPYACSQVGGIGSSLDGIDVAAFVYCANVADAQNWKISAWPDTSMDESVVLDQMLQAAGAWRSRLSGKISCVSRGYPQASLLTVTAADTAGDVELAFTPSRRDRKNTATPYYLSEANKWDIAPASPVSNPAWLTEDKGKRSKRVDLPYVPQVAQAAQLAYYELADAREPLSGTVPFKPHMRRIKPGDCFTFSAPGFQLDGVKVRALRRTFDAKTGIVSISFRQETDAKHTDAAIAAGVAPPVTDPNTPVTPKKPARIPTTRTNLAGDQTIYVVTQASTASGNTISVIPHVAIYSDGPAEEFAAGSVSSLIASTVYGVFGKDGGSIYEVEAQPAKNHFSDGNWTFIGWQMTPNAEGGYTPPPEPTVPPGSGGGGGYPRYFAPETP